MTSKTVNKKFYNAVLFYIGHKEFSKVIPKTREPHIQSGKKMSLKYGLQELEIENNSVSIVSEVFHNKTKCQDKYWVLTTYTIRQ